MSRGVLPWAFSLWWVVGLQGLAALILGILLLTVPEATAAFFWVAVGLYLFLYGMGTLFNALFHRQLHRSRWQWLGGLLSAVGGLVAISNPMLGFNLTATVLSYVVGVAAIVPKANTPRSKSTQRGCRRPCTPQARARSRR